jgi:hypothetical protein
MFELQQSTLGQLDFDAVARAESKRILWERHGATLLARLAAFDELVGRPLSLLAKVTAVARARMN